MTEGGDAMSGGGDAVSEGGALDGASWIDAESRRRLEDALSVLDADEREALVLRLGLRDGVPRRLEEVEQATGLSRERLHDAERRAFARLDENA